MRSYVMFHPHGAYAMISLLLIVLLTSACGSNPPTVAPTTSGNTSMSVRVLSPEGIHCRVDSQSPLPGTLVLDTSRLNYDSVTIQKMTEYVDDAFLSEDLPTVPDGFKLAQVGLPQEVKLWNTGTGTICEWALQITNLDEEKTIQLGQLQMRLHALPSQNRYTLVDICSLPLVVRQGSCLPGQTGGGNNYTYNFDLGTGKADRVIQGQLTGGAYDPTLPPGKTVEVDSILAAPASAGGINYSVTPQITMNMSGEQRILPIDQLQTTISLVTVQQLSCYTLHGNTFEPLPSKPRKDVWCL